MKTLLLELDNWDLCLDIKGDIAVASSPYSIAQDVASAVKLFAGELWYNGAAGVPYFTQILGTLPPASLFRAELIKAALTVPGVVEARVITIGMTGRLLSGTIEVIDQTGQANNVSF